MVVTAYMQSDENQFVQSLDSISTANIFTAIERECRKLERFTSANGVSLNDEAVSSLIFRRFLNVVMLGVHLSHSALPAEQYVACRKIAERLVEEKKLPLRTLEEFVQTFSSDTSR